MKEKYVMVLLGTRPEAIKLCPLILALRQEAALRVIVLLSGQHREMVLPVLRYFGIEPDGDLALMCPGQTPLSLTERMLAAFPAALKRYSPDLCLVHGDTTTAFAGALCCFYTGIPVAHIEAGLRTNDHTAPFPEEFNRRAIDAMADWFFAPTARAAQALLREGCPEERVFTVGNTATDVLRLCVGTEFDHPLLSMARGKRLLLLTAHRREMSEEERMCLLCAIRREIEGRRDVLLFFPVHPSPAVGRAAHAAFDGCPNVVLLPPLEIPVLQNLLARATLLLTDSGGLQEEATYLGVPTLVLRDVTERPEGVDAGVLRLAGTRPEAVRAALAALLDDERTRQTMSVASDVFGDGHVSERIARQLTAVLRHGMA